MTNYFINRSKESLASKEVMDNPEALFLLSAHDQDVALNGGRIGSRWAPRSLLSHFKKLTLPLSNDFSTWKSIQVLEEHSQFPSHLEAQLEGAAQIDKALRNHPQMNSLIHLGGGHGQIFSLITALSNIKSFEKIVVLNIDAHADTRTDSILHSGNPFRQLTTKISAPIQLFQMGLNPYTNSPSTLSKFSSPHEMDILWRESCNDKKQVEEFWTKIHKALTPQSLFILSLDADALHSSSMRAVSAVNHDGLSVEFVNDQIKTYKLAITKLGLQNIFGIYEFNPLYDDCSGSGARTLAYLLYQFLT